MHHAARGVGLDNCIGTKCTRLFASGCSLPKDTPAPINVEQDYDVRLRKRRFLCIVPCAAARAPCYPMANQREAASVRIASGEGPLLFRFVRSGLCKLYSIHGVGVDLAVWPQAASSVWDCVNRPFNLATTQPV